MKKKSKSSCFDAKKLKIRIREKKKNSNTVGLITMKIGTSKFFSRRPFYAKYFTITHRSLCGDTAHQLLHDSTDYHESLYA